MATDNHDLNEPAEGAADWHIPVNENWRGIDTIAPIYDTSGNRSTYVPKAGAIYCETDTGDWYSADGSSWSKFGEFGGGSGTLTAQMDISVTDDGYSSLAEDDRPLYSQDHVRHYIDPVNGGTYANADGSQGDPYEAVDDSFYHMGYSAQLHQFQVTLDNPGATYEAGHPPPTTLGYRGKFGPDSGRTFYLHGDPSNPQDYTFEDANPFEVGFTLANDMINATFEGVYFKGGVNIWGQTRFINCHFGGNTNAGDATAIRGTGRAEFQECTFTSDADYMALTDGFLELSFRNCDFDVSSRMFNVPTDNTASMFWFDNEPTDSTGSDVILYETAGDRDNHRGIVHAGGAELTGTDRTDFLVS